MHYRTRHRIQTIPLVLVLLCLLNAVAVASLRTVSRFLEGQLAALPIITLCVSLLVPVAFMAWYLFCYCEIRQGQLRMRWLWKRRSVNLRDLTNVEVCGVGRRRLALMLADASGRELALPLGVWRDEDLIMARVLRATVECKQRIEGEPETVRDFSGMLESYKSWDRRLGAAA